MLRKQRSLAILFSLCACSSTKDRVRLYGEISCGGGKTAYLTADGKSATCMDEERAAYIMCARELSLASVSSEANREFESGLKLEVEGVELDANAQAKLFERAVATWESNADVSKARAEAIRTCKEMLKPSPANTAKAGNPAKAAKP